MLHHNPPPPLLDCFPPKPYLFGKSIKMVIKTNSAGAKGFSQRGENCLWGCCVVSRFRMPKVHLSNGFSSFYFYRFPCVGENCFYIHPPQVFLLNVPRFNFSIPFCHILVLRQTYIIHLIFTLCVRHRPRI